MTHTARTAFPTQQHAVLPRLTVCIVGAGPRGVSVLERISANARLLVPDKQITVHIVDPYRPGAGQVWRTWQSRHLLMNTVASQVTLFTDKSVDIDGPVSPGPSLHEWADLLILSGQIDRYDEATRAEARRLGPDSYPTRAFYGTYLEWVFRRIVRTAPENMSVVVHCTNALTLDDTTESLTEQTVLLGNGTRLTKLDAVVLAQGHLPTNLTATEKKLGAFAAAQCITYVPPANPADVDLSAIPAGTPVLLRGLGLNFFDYMALLTVGRGGHFENREGTMVYRPSGREPRIHAGSRRGVPYQARGENEKGAHGRHLPILLTPKTIERLQEQAARCGGLDFARDLWPLVSAEVEIVYYTTLLAACGRHRAAESFTVRYLAACGQATKQRRVLADFDIELGSRWDWDSIAHPYRSRRFTGPADFQSWLVAHLQSDVNDARAGNISGAVKAALDVLRDLRNEIRLLVDHGGLTGTSYREDLDNWYTPLNAFLSIGPPVRRVEEMIALIEAGVLHVLGPDLRIRTDPNGKWFMASSTVPGSTTQVIALIEARLPMADIRRTSDPLVRHLLSTGQCAAYRISDPHAKPYQTGGLAVTKRPYHLLDVAGRAHPRRFAFGVPTESVHWVTAAGVRPGVNSVTLGDSDAIARAMLALARQPADDKSLLGVAQA